jgi:hypothetical protein
MAGANMLKLDELPQQALAIIATFLPTRKDRFVKPCGLDCMLRRSTAPLRSPLTSADRNQQ